MHKKFIWCICRQAATSKLFLTAYPGSIVQQKEPALLNILLMQKFDLFKRLPVLQNSFNSNEFCCTDKFHVCCKRIFNWKTRRSFCVCNFKVFKSVIKKFK